MRNTNILLGLIAVLLLIAITAQVAFRAGKEYVGVAIESSGGRTTLYRISRDGAVERATGRGTFTGPNLTVYKWEMLPEDVGQQ